MKKLQLNKKTISVLDKKEMSTVSGGQAEFLSISSCRASKRVTRSCCYSHGIAEVGD